MTARGAIGIWFGFQSSVDFTIEPFGLSIPLTYAPEFLQMAQLAQQNRWLPRALRASYNLSFPNNHRKSAIVICETEL
jgi:hypothetical protein